MTIHKTTLSYLQDRWLENLGVDIEWQTIDSETFRQEYLRKESHGAHLLLNGWRQDYPDPDSFLGLGGIAQLIERWGNTEYSGLIERARRSTDQPSRLSMYQRADWLLMEEAVLMPIAYAQRHYLVKPWVVGFPSGMQPGRLWKDVAIEPH